MTLMESIEPRSVRPLRSVHNPVHLRGVPSKRNMNPQAIDGSEFVKRKVPTKLGASNAQKTELKNKRRDWIEKTVAEWTSAYDIHDMTRAAGFKYSIDTIYNDLRALVHENRVDLRRQPTNRNNWVKVYRRAVDQPPKQE